MRTPTVPIGQSELSMSMVCLARSPWGVLVPMWTPYAASAGAGPVFAQPLARATTIVTATVSPAAPCRARPALRLRAGPSNVQHNLELQQRRARGHGICSLACVRLDRGAGRPRLERLF